jgi:hypothetical protein
MIFDKNWIELAVLDGLLPRNRDAAAFDETTHMDVAGRMAFHRYVDGI